MASADIWKECVVSIVSVEDMSLELDPAGDIRLILYNTPSKFAPWEADDSINSDVLSPPLDRVDNDLIYQLPRRKIAQPKRRLAIPRDEVSEFNEVGGASATVQMSDGNNSVVDEQKSSRESSIFTTRVEPVSSTKREAILTLRLSSRHLILSSRYFERMLTNNWKERDSLNRHGHSAVEMENWDPEALSIVMNIVHHRIRQIPRRVELELLAKIAILVDYLDCVEAVEPFPEMWIKEVDKTPEKYGRELVLWIMICWVFQRSASGRLKNLTTIALEQSRGPIKTLGLPIPGSLVGRYRKITTLEEG